MTAALVISGIYLLAYFFFVLLMHLEKFSQQIKNKLGMIIFMYLVITVLVGLINQFKGIPNAAGPNGALWGNIVDVLILGLVTAYLGLCLGFFLRSIWEGLCWIKTKYQQMDNWLRQIFDATSS